TVSGVRCLVSRSGYTGEGAKTIIPASSMAKISMRLVPDQDPRKIREAFESYVKSLKPEVRIVGVETEALRATIVIEASPEAG
ncbi:MAG: peptidase dimerization domain-containing protein, partial [Hyphomicrobiales bacterium]